MSDLFRATVRQERPRNQKPVVCLVRFENEATATHRKTRDDGSAAYGVGAQLRIELDGRWLRCEIVERDQWGFVVRRATGALK